MINDEPIDYFDGVEWSRIQPIENNTSERIIKQPEFQWRWSNQSKEALTRFSRVGGLFLPVEKLKRELEAQWGSAPAHLLEFQGELAGTYFEPSAKARILLGISKVCKREDFNSNEIPCEEFFFSNYDDYGFKHYIRHDGLIESGGSVIFNNVKTFLEEHIISFGNYDKIAGSAWFRVNFVNINGKMMGALDMEIASFCISNGLLEVHECRDSLNYLYVSDTSILKKNVNWNQGGDLSFDIEFRTQDEKLADTFSLFARSLNLGKGEIHTISEMTNKGESI